MVDRTEAGDRGGVVAGRIRRRRRWRASTPSAAGYYIHGGNSYWAPKSHRQHGGRHCKRSVWCRWPQEDVLTGNARTSRRDSQGARRLRPGVAAVEFPDAPCLGTRNVPSAQAMSSSRMLRISPARKPRRASNRRMAGGSRMPCGLLRSQDEISRSTSSAGR